MTDTLKRSDQIALLESAAEAAKTGTWKGLFTYPGCGYDLVRMGLVTEGDGKLTDAGAAALWLLDKGPDPLPDTASSVTFSIPLPAEEPTP